MDVKWVKIRSFHAVKEEGGQKSGLPPWQLTYCGRETRGTVLDDLPAERSCESCLRIIARKADA